MAKNPTHEDLAAYDARNVRELPNTVEVEQALLGALFVNNAAYSRVSNLVEPEHFYQPLHQRIYEYAGHLITAGRAANPITLKPFFGKEKIDNSMTVAQYLIRLAADSVMVINAADYALIIHEMWWRRRCITIGQDLVETMFEMAPGSPPRNEAMAFREQLADLDTKALADGPIDELGTRYYNSVVMAKDKSLPTGVPICLAEIARVISEPCFEAANYYGLLSASGEGKTSLTVQMILHALKAGHPVLFQSFDQTGEQIVRQMAAQEFEMEARRQRFGNLNQAEMQQAKVFSDQINQWERSRLFKVMDCTDQTAVQLVESARTFCALYRRRRRPDGEEDKTPFIVTDHIGSIQSTEDKRADAGRVAKVINATIKGGAKSLNVAWLMLNQRNSAGMQRDNPRPISQDLYGGDPAKQAYDAIFYLYRFLKYFKDREAVAMEKDWKRINAIFPEGVRNGTQDVAEIGSIKVRFGDPTIRETVDFQAKFTRYRSVIPDYDKPQQANFESFDLGT